MYYREFYRTAIIQKGKERSEGGCRCTNLVHVVLSDILPMIVGPNVGLDRNVFFLFLQKEFHEDVIAFVLAVEDYLYIACHGNDIAGREMPVRIFPVADRKIITPVQL